MIWPDFRRLYFTILVFITVTHLWAITFIRHRKWQSAEFLDYPLGCDDMPQCARFGSSLFGQVLTRAHDLIIALYFNIYRNTLAKPEFDGVVVELRSSSEQFTKAMYSAFLGLGTYWVFRKLLGTPVKSLISVNGLLIVFSGSWLPVIVRIVDRFVSRSELLAKFNELLRMQQLEFLMHYDYLVVLAYLSAIFVLKSLQGRQIRWVTCLGYGFLLGSVYEGLVPVIVIAYTISMLRKVKASISFRYVLALITGQAAATITAYGLHFNNNDVYWISKATRTYGADNMEYLPYVGLLIAVIGLISFSLGYLLSFVVRSIDMEAYRDVIISMVLSLLVLHVLGFGVAGYTNEAVRQTLGLQSLVFTLGITSGGNTNRRDDVCRKLCAHKPRSLKMAKP